MTGGGAEAKAQEILSDWGGRCTDPVPGGGPCQALRGEATLGPLSPSGSPVTPGMRRLSGRLREFPTGWPVET